MPVRQALAVAALPSGAPGDPGGMTRAASVAAAGGAGKGNGGAIGRLVAGAGGAGGAGGTRLRACSARRAARQRSAAAPVRRSAASSRLEGLPLLVEPALFVTFALVLRELPAGGADPLVQRVDLLTRGHQTDVGHCAGSQCRRLMFLYFSPLSLNANTSHSMPTPPSRIATSMRPLALPRRQALETALQRSRVVRSCSGCSSCAPTQDHEDVGGFAGAQVVLLHRDADHLGIGVHRPDCERISGRSNACSASTMSGC